MKIISILLLFVMLLTGCETPKREDIVEPEENTVVESESKAEESVEEFALAPEKTELTQLKERVLDDLNLSDDLREDFLVAALGDQVMFSALSEQLERGTIERYLLGLLHRDYFSMIGDLYFGEPSQSDKLVFERDIEQGLKWYEYAFNHDPSSKDYANLGHHYLFGEYLPQDLTKAVDCYDKAIERGSSADAVFIAELYYSGNTLPFDGDKAYEYYTKALERVERPADEVSIRFSLNRCLERGYGVQQNPEKVEAYYNNLMFEWGEFSRNSYNNYALLRRSEREPDPLVANRLRRLANGGYLPPIEYSEERTQERLDQISKMWHSGQDPVANNMKASVLATETFPKDMVEALLESFYSMELGLLQGNIGGINWLESYYPEDEEMKEYDFEPVLGALTKYYISDYRGTGTKSVIPAVTEGTGNYIHFYLKEGYELPSSSGAQAQMFEWKNRGYFVYQESRNWGAIGVDWAVLAVNEDGTIEQMKLTYENMMPQKLVSLQQSEWLATEWLATKWLATEGLVSEALVPEALVPEALVPAALVPAALVPAGLAPAGFSPEAELLLSTQIEGAVRGTRDRVIYRPEEEKEWAFPPRDLEEEFRPYTEENGLLADVNNDGVEDEIFRGFMIDNSYYKYYQFLFHSYLCPDGAVSTWSEWETANPNNLSSQLGVTSDLQSQFWTIEDNGITYCVMLYSADILHQARVFSMIEGEVEEISRYLYMEEYQNVSVTFPEVTAELFLNP